MGGGEEGIWENQSTVKSIHFLLRQELRVSKRPCKCGRQGFPIPRHWTLQTALSLKARLWRLAPGALSNGPTIRAGPWNAFDFTPKKCAALHVDGVVLEDPTCRVRAIIPKKQRKLCTCRHPAASPPSLIQPPALLLAPSHHQNRGLIRRIRQKGRSFDWESFTGALVIRFRTDLSGPGTMV